jgi:uncharacterized membrane protein YoaK (UPF0700 family)
MIWIGGKVAIAAAAAGKTAPGVPPLDFLAQQLAGLLLFAVLVALAIFFRRSAAAHKRLMLLATIGMLAPAIARLSLQFFPENGVLVARIVADGFIVIAVAYDLLRLRRIHPANLWGGSVVIASQPLRAMLGHTALWQGIATWLVS